MYSSPYYVYTQITLTLFLCRFRGAEIGISSKSVIFSAATRGGCSEDSETVDTIILFIPCPLKLKTSYSISHCVNWHEPVIHASFMPHITKRRQMEAATQSSHQLIKLKTKLVAEMGGLKWEQKVRTVDSFIIRNSVSKLFMVHGEFDHSRGSETERSRPTCPRCVGNKNREIR